MTTELSAPLVPAEVDLRDFGFMPLDVLRLRDSDLAALATGDEFKAAVLLWCVAWHQVPAGSLPDDDRLLARYSGAGSTWRKVKEEALRGFVKCLDGRLYHQVIATKALESWAKKQAQRDRTKAATEAREAKRRAAEIARHEQRDVERNEQRDEQRDVERDEQRDEQRDVQRDVVQGTGTVKGQGQGEKGNTGERARGARLPSDWTLPAEWSDWAKKTRPDLDPAVTACKFRDYWAAKPGAAGRKLDWQATWRNWVREERAAPPLKVVNGSRADELNARNIATAQRFIERMEAKDGQH